MCLMILLTNENFSTIYGGGSKHPSWDYLYAYCDSRRYFEGLTTQKSRKILKEKRTNSTEEVHKTTRTITNKEKDVSSRQEDEV